VKTDPRLREKGQAITWLYFTILDIQYSQLNSQDVLQFKLAKSKLW